MNCYLFAYGSMKKDFINHNRLINEKFIGNSLKGYIPSNELMRYLTEVKNYINENDKRTYYAF